jgi:hypothetical protein
MLIEEEEEEEESSAALRRRTNISPSALADFGKLVLGWAGVAAGGNRDADP